MKPSEFIRTLDEASIVHEIQEAEKNTSGEIRVFVDPRPETDPLTAAQRLFQELGMERTRLRNGVLVYLAPSTRAFAVIGDSGIHEHCGNDFWEDVAARMGARLREGEPTAALIAAVRTIGARLAEYFPHEPDDRNELPDQIAPG